MSEEENKQYFLIIDKLNLFPEMHQEPIKIIEQIINAVLITNENNLYHAFTQIQKIIKCTKHNLRSKEELLPILGSILQENNLNITSNENINALYPRYHHLMTSYSEFGKQAHINIDFASRKKLSFDGHNVSYDTSFYLWVIDLVNNQVKTGRYNSFDKLIFYKLQPLISLEFMTLKNTIEKECDQILGIEFPC